MNLSAVRVFCSSEPNGLASGAGFVVGRGAYVITNRHVVSCAEDGGAVRVLLDAVSGEAIMARVTAWDVPLDLAVLQLERRIDRPDVRFATLATLRQRDAVVAVGFPVEADASGNIAALTTATLTEGVIGRLLPVPADPDDGPGLVQISAALNPGNSGGPLFDAYGRVIGINSIKSLVTVPTVSGDGGEVRLQRIPAGEGLGWAVVSDSLLPMLDRLGIPYEVAWHRPHALVRLWHREPLLVIALGLVMVLSLAILGMLMTGAARNGMRARVTRPPRVAPASSAPVAPPRPVLRGLSGPYAGQVIPLTGDPVAIGRNPALAQLVMPGAQTDISQRHALIGYDAEQDRFVLEDCWSTNGVFLMTGRAEVTTVPPGQVRTLKAGARFYLATPAISFEVGYQ